MAYYFFNFIGHTTHFIRAKGALFLLVLPLLKSVLEITIVLHMYKKKKTRFILMHVTDAPRGSPDVIIDNTQPIEGESVILNCSISNIDSYFPLISSNWVKDGVPHTEWANESIINIEVKQTDSANYSCSVGNFIGNSVDADAVYLDVLRK